MEEDENGNGSEKVQKRFRLPSSLLVIAWLVIFIGTATFGYVLDGLFINGHLQDEWLALTDAQAEILGQLITVYAAAFAAIVTPAIFSGKFASLEEKLKEATREVESYAQQTRASLHTISETSATQIGLKEKYETGDLSRSKDILLVMQARAAEFAQLAKDRSRKWKKKEQFKGKWPTRQNYVELLLRYEMISKDEFDLFMKILRSRRFTHGENPQTITVAQLNDVSEAFSKLQEKFDDGQSESQS